MLTYVHNFRYVVNYIGVREGRPTRDLPISTFLTDRSRQYRRQETKSQSDRSWQVMDGKQQWIHWYVHTCCARSHVWPLGILRTDQIGLGMGYSAVSCSPTAMLL